jgi:hypothetical protein
MRKALGIVNTQESQGELHMQLGVHESTPVSKDGAHDVRNSHQRR